MMEPTHRINQKNSQNDSPFVSVVIPFFNNQKEVIRIEKSLRNQTYSYEHFEIIFIDNGSTKSFKFSDGFLERNILIEEKNHLNSPYSARNRGIEASKGQVIAFIDANSFPEKEWLETGIRCLQQVDCDLAGGDVQFDFQGKITAAKIVDALTSVNMRKAIEERGAAYTANLFVKREIFKKAGLFEEGVRSGGDVRWTLKVKKNGYNIFYCKESVVKKYARSTRALYQKKIRTGKGYFYTWQQEPQESRTAWYYNFFRSLKPPTFSRIRNLDFERYHQEFKNKKEGVWFHVYFSAIVEQLAFIFQYFKYRLSFKQSFNEKI